MFCSTFVPVIYRSQSFRLMKVLYYGERCCSASLVGRGNGDLSTMHIPPLGWIRASIDTETPLLSLRPIERRQLILCKCTV